MSSILYVGRLAVSVTTVDLEELFAGAGEVRRATVAVEKISGQSKGFGFVEMASPVEAVKAKQLFDGMEFKGTNIMLSVRPPGNDPFDPDRD